MSAPPPRKPMGPPPARPPPARPPRKYIISCLVRQSIQWISRQRKMEVLFRLVE